MDVMKSGLAECTEPPWLEALLRAVDIMARRAARQHTSSCASVRHRFVESRAVGSGALLQT